MIKIFDLEVYPNYFLLNYIDYTTRKKYSFEISEYENNTKEILKFIRNKKDLIVGHNILGYDLIMLNCIFQNQNYFNRLTNLEICLKLKEISDKIIKKKRNEKWDSEMIPLLDFRKYNCIDTLSIMNTVDRVGIKQASINLKYHNVQDLPFEPSHYLTKEEQKIVKEYCFNDCMIGLLLYEKKQPDIELRKDVSSRYGIDVTNSNDTGIAKKVLNKYYSEYTGLDVKEFKDLRSYNKPFFLKELLPEIEFKTQKFKKLYEWFSLQEITEKTDIGILDDEEKEIKKTKIYYDLILPNITVRFALGGCHSQDTPDKFITTEKEELIDFDFNSWYPNLLLNYQIKPRHVKPEFLTIVKTLTLERIKDKQEGRKKEADIKKIIINSIYGLLGSDYYWLKDTKALLKITIAGQLWLAKLLEDLYLENMNVISMNTDGILCLIKKEEKDRYYDICNLLSKDVNVEGEYSYYKEYIRKDVNNYLSIDLKNKTKEKGKYFSREIQLSKGYYYPIIAKALVNFYLNNIPIEKTINEEENIYMFMSSQKVDTNKFNPEFHYFEDNIVKEKRLQKINRWVITNKGGKFLKIEKDENKYARLKDKELCNKIISDTDKKNKKISVEKNYFLQILNNVKDINPKKYDLNYDFYIKICNDTINDISPKTKQLSLF
jgi:hypothetical protein